MKIRIVFIYLLIIGFLAVPAFATTADLGNPQTIGKHNISIYNGYEYGSKFAVRYNTTSATTIDAVGFYRYMDYDIGTGGIYSAQLVNDEDGLPGSTVLAENASFTQSGPLYGKQEVLLNRSVDLEANTKYWIIFDGSQADIDNHMDFAIVDTQIQPDGIFGIDYQRWPVARWNGTAWSTPYLRLNSYPVYGIVWVYNDGEVVGDGQFACREDTQSIYSIYTYGNKITNAPTTAYKINSVSARLSIKGTPAELYLTVLDKNKSEIASVPASIQPANWSKTTYTFSPAIEIPAGNSEIYIFFKSPNSTSKSCYQTRAIEYVDKAHSYQYTERYLISGASFYSKSEFDEMMNVSIIYGEENSINNYFVSPVTGDDNNPGSATLPWKTLSRTSSRISANSSLWLMPGVYANDTLTISKSNVNVSAFSTGANITMKSGQVNAIYGNYADNITIDGINITGAGDTDNTNACCIYFRYGDNITVSNCTITDGNDGIRFRGGNDTLAQENTISRMRYHGIHLYGQMEPAKYSRNSVIRNDISNCGHNMVDLHSNISNCKIANNDVYFTDDWTGNKNNVGIFLHNGNIPNTIVENNTVHHLGRPLELNNANDCTIRNNSFYDGLNWGTGLASKSRILIEGIDCSIQGMNSFGCHNLTFTENTFDGLGYVYTFYHLGDIEASFNNITSRNNTYSDIETANFRKVTKKATSEIYFIDENFTNFKLAYDYGATINDKDISFTNNSMYPIFSNSGSPCSLTGDVFSLRLKTNDTDVWYGSRVSTPQSASNLNGASSLNFGGPISIESMDISTVSRGHSTIITTLPITLTSTSAQTDYPVRITLSYDAAMLPDFSDVRFRDTNGDALPYWIESKTDSETATFWVKIPTLNNGETQISATYGNHTLSSASNGSAVFTFFDDFEDGEISSAWTVGSNVTATETCGQLVIIPNNKATTTGTIDSCVYHPVTMTNSFEIEASVDYTGQGVTDKGNIFLMAYQANWYGLYGGLFDISQTNEKAPYQSMLYSSKKDTAPYLPVNGSMNIRLNRNSLNSTKVFNDTMQVTYGTYATSFSSIRLFNQRYEGQPVKIARWNYVLLRKMVDTEPAYVIGEPDTPTITPAYPVNIEVLGGVYKLLNSSITIKPSAKVQYINFTTDTADWDYTIEMALASTANFSGSTVNGCKKQ